MEQCSNTESKPIYINRITRIIPGLVGSIFVVGIPFFCLSTFKYGLESEATRDVISWIYTNLDLINPNRMYSSKYFFPNNPYPDILNGSLWTITFEFWSYLFLLVISIFVGKLGKFLSTKSTNVMQIATPLLIATILLFSPVQIQETGSLKYFLHNLMPCILLGAAMSSYSKFHHKILSGKYLAILMVLSLSLLGLTFVERSYLNYGVFFLAFFVCIICNINLSQKPVFSRLSIDPSYGIYLYAFPITQVLIALGLHNLSCLVLVSGILSYFLGILSFRFIESRYMKTVTFTKREREKSRKISLAN